MKVDLSISRVLLSKAFAITALCCWTLLSNTRCMAEETSSPVAEQAVPIGGLPPSTSVAPPTAQPLPFVEAAPPLTADVNANETVDNVRQLRVVRHWINQTFDPGKLTESLNRRLEQANVAPQVRQEIVAEVLASVQNQHLQSVVAAQNAQTPLTAANGSVPMINPNIYQELTKPRYRIGVVSRTVQVVDVTAGENVGAMSLSRSGGAASESPAQFLRVDSVEPSSPAESADIKKDDLLLKAGDQPLTSINVLIDAVQAAGHAESDLKLSVLRGTEILNKTLQPVLAAPTSEDVTRTANIHNFQQPVDPIQPTWMSMYGLRPEQFGFSGAGQPAFTTGPVFIIDPTTANAPGMTSIRSFEDHNHFESLQQQLAALSAQVMELKKMVQLLQGTK